MDTNFKYITNIKIALVYILLFFGGLWNMLGYFSELMKTLSGPFMIIISLYLLYEILNIKPKINYQNTPVKPIEKYRNRYLIYFCFVVIISWLIEYIGVKTGYIFGTYKYGEVLKPQIFQVPLAIGFAWFSSLIVSIGIMQKYTKINLRLISNFKKALIAGFLMTVFDYILEIAAIKLGYWQWGIGIVPSINYVAWFVFGTTFAYFGYKFDILNQRLPRIAHHLFFAQIIYFILSSIKL